MAFFLAVAGIKLSIVFFYMRLSGVTSKKWMICHWTLAIILILYSIVTVLISVFNCTPLFVNWDIERMSRLKEPPACLDSSKIIAGLSVIHVLTDLSLLAVPIFLLWKAQVKRTVKLRIWLVGIVGATSCVTSAVRLVEQFRHEYTDGTCRRNPQLSRITRISGLTHIFREQSRHGQLGPRRTRHRSNRCFPPGRQLFCHTDGQALLQASFA